MNTQFNPIEFDGIGIETGVTRERDSMRLTRFSAECCDTSAIGQQAVAQLVWFRIITRIAIVQLAAVMWNWQTTD
jgi:hypothetical protein